MNLVEPVTNILSLLTLFGGAYVIVLLFALITKSKKIIQVVSTNAILIGFIISLTATLGSLFFSEVAKYTPCILCWYQRIFMYPLPIIFGLAIIKKDTKIIDYALLLSAIGAAIAGYHYVLQINPNILAPCSTVGISVSCTDKLFLHYGYITIPMMSLTAFLMIFMSLLSKKISDNR